MPKIVGFLSIVITVGFLMSAVYDSIDFYLKYGASSREILATIATAMTGGGTIILFLWILWG